MSIDEESFPYDSLLDAMDNELNTEFHMVSAEGFKTYGCSSTFISEPKTNAVTVNVSGTEEHNDKNVTVVMERYKNTTYTKNAVPKEPTITTETTTTKTLTDSKGLLGRASSLDCVLQHKERERVFSYQDIHPLHIRRRYQNVESKVGKVIAEHSAEPIKRAKRQNLNWNDDKMATVSVRTFDEQLMQEHDRLKSLCNYLNERLQEKNVDTVRLKQNLDNLRIKLMQAQDKIHDMELTLRKNQHAHMYHGTNYLNISTDSVRNTIGTQTGIPTPPTPQPLHPAFLLLTERATINDNNNCQFSYNIESSPVPVPINNNNNSNSNNNSKFLITKMPSIRQTNYKKVQQSSAHKASNNNNNNNNQNNINNSKSTGPASSERGTATSHSTSNSKSNSTSLNSINSSVYAGGDRSDTYCITSNDEPNPSYDSRSRRSSFRCSSDSAIEIDPIIPMPYEEHPQLEHRQKQKLHKERLQLFQRRSRHAYNNINANNSYDVDSNFHNSHTNNNNNDNNDIIVYKSDNLRDLNGVHGRFRTLNVTLHPNHHHHHEHDNEGLIPVPLQTNNNNNNNNINRAYFIENNRVVGYKNHTTNNNDDHKCVNSQSTRNFLRPGCLWFFKPCTHCLDTMSVSQDTSLFEMNLLTNQSTFSEPQPR